MVQRFAVRCSVLQYVAVCCSEGCIVIFLEKEERVDLLKMFCFLMRSDCPDPQPHCNTLQHTLQHTVRHCSTLQHTVTHCSTLQHTTTHCSTHCNTQCTFVEEHSVAATYCKTLQDTARHCNIVQTTARHCNTLQHTLQHNVAHTAAHCNAQCNSVPLSTRTASQPILPAYTTWLVATVLHCVLQCATVRCSV